MYLRQTRIDRHSRKSPGPEYIPDEEYYNPDENMDYVSKSLLAQDDICYNESVLFNQWKSANRFLFTF